MMYHKRSDQLTQQQALDCMQAVLHSAYFQQYHPATNSRLHADMIGVDRFGGYEAEKFTLGNLTDSIDALVASIQNNQAVITEFILNVRAPMSVKTKYFSRKVAEESYAMEVSFQMRGSGDTYEFVVYNDARSMEERPKEQQEQYKKWYRALTRQLKKSLPQLPR